MNINLEVTKSPALPHEPGAYVVWLSGARFPVVLCWALMSTYWVRGATRVAVDAWAGPLPDRRKA